ncbi:MAG: YraN family protein [Acidobacteria bacterium]|nr:YraN family protein [Acidobacteriota bacterium]
MGHSPLPGTSPRSLRTAWIGLQQRILRSFARRSRLRSRLPDHLATGRDGEREALFYLRRIGYTVVARRWRNPKLRGDLDLVAWDNNTGDRATLCFIEIKTRTRHDAVPAEMAVDDDKQQTLRQLARSYMRRLPKAAQQAPMRFDVLSVYLEPAGQGRSETRHPETNDGNAMPDFVLNKGAFQWA